MFRAIRAFYNTVLRILIFVALRIFNKKQKKNHKKIKPEAVANYQTDGFHSFTRSNRLVEGFFPHTNIDWAVLLLSARSRARARDRVSRGSVTAIPFIKVCSML